MSGDSGISIFLGIAFLLFFLFTNRGNKKKEEREEEIVIPLPEKKMPPIKARKVEKKVHQENLETKDFISSAYDVVERKKHAVLQPGWNKKASIRQAFVLSEILRKVDER